MKSTTQKVHHFYSVGTRATQPLFSDLSRNFYFTMDLNGNPFFSGTQPNGAVSKYDYNRIAIAVGDYFVDNLFGGYEYYRVKKIETIFNWVSTPTNGLINGELYTSLDKDSRDAETSNAYINRPDLKRYVFSNRNPSHSVSYTPFMVDFVDDDEIDKVAYIQPQNRWWNCADFRNHRWGCLRYVAVNNNSNAYTSDASVFVRHRIWIEVKGQKDVVTPSVPPAIQGLGKQMSS